MVHVEILNQLGGRRFLAMTGAKNLVYSQQQNNYLSFKIGRNKSGANYIKIVLNSMDTYDMKFIKIFKDKMTTVAEFENIYNDQLQEIFTDVTGLYTSL